MNTKIKTLDGWHEFSDRTGKTSIYDFLYKGDIVEESLVDYFMNIMPPRAIGKNYLQVGEPYSHSYDIDHRLRTIYMTFAKCDGQWRYYGNCFAWETIDKTYY